MNPDNVQKKEPEYQHQSKVVLINQMTTFEKQIILNKQKECTTDDQHMFDRQSLNNFNNNKLLELDE